MLKTSNDQRKLLPNFEHLFATTAQAPGGVARLRELILTLAVQGKLVAQDPSDEPASELLKKIRAEKDRLIAEGKIKKDKPLAEITDEEKPFELPVGWEWVPLQYIGYTQTGTTPDKKNSDFYGNHIPFIKPGDIYQNYVDYENEGLSEVGLDKSGRLAPKGSILMVCIGTIGKSNIIQRDCSFNQQINSITPLICNSNFVNIYLHCPEFQFQAWSRSSSTTIAILNKGKWEEIPIALPPLAEQSRIVARVEALMRLCDALEEKGRLEHTQHQQLLQAMLDSLTQTTDAHELARHWQRLAQHFDLLIDRPEAVDALEQTILQLAVRGLLVPQDPSDEPASELLKKIRAEKDRLIAEGKIKKDKPLPVIGEDEKPFELPVGWEWVRVGQVAIRVQYGVTASADHTQSEPKFVRITDIQNDQVNWNTVPSMSGVNQEFPEYYLNSGDILVARTGGTIGKSFLVSSVPLKAVFASYLIRISPASGVNPSYLKIFASSGHYWQQLYAKSMGTGQPNVNGTALSELTLPLPPLAEQSRIVARVTELRALCQQLRDKLTQARTTQTQLAQAWVEQVAG